MRRTRSFPHADLFRLGYARPLTVGDLDQLAKEDLIVPTDQDVLFSVLKLLSSLLLILELFGLLLQGLGLTGGA